MRLLVTALVTFVASPLAAQNCFWGDFGTSLGYGTTDTVYAIRPIGFAFPFAGASYTDIHVNDHGFVQLSNGGVPAPLTTNSPALYTPTVGNFVAGGPKIAPLYSDMTLAGGGECWIRSTPTQCTVTWHNVQSSGIPSPRFSFQLVLRPNGDVQFTYGPGCTNNSTYGGVSANAIVGITNGVGVTPASRDLSAGGSSFAATTHEEFVGANTFDLANNTLRFENGIFSVVFSTAGAPANCATTTRYGAGCDGLGLGAVGLPAIGNTSFQLRAESLPAVSPLAFFAFGTVAQNPGLPLGPLLGMTGCSGHTNADLGIFGGSPAATGPTGITPVSVYGLAIPVSAPLIGTTFATQALALSLANPFGLASSNGLELRLGIDGSRLLPNPQLNMVAIAPGTFQMGQVGVAEPVHQVTLTQPFWMGKHEVTQAQYQAVMGSNPSFFQGVSAPNAPQRPVEQVSWNNAIAYCQALTASEQAAGRVPAGYQYRLPTEAEWEYCCRAGTTTEWNTGISLSTSQANFQGALANATYPNGQTAVVGSYAPNAFGLHDMHGNVREWCLDSLATYASGPVTDPFVTGGAYRVIRGGSWYSGSSATFCRSAYRIYRTPGSSDNFGGFRVVLAPVLLPNPLLNMVPIAPGTFQMGSTAGSSNEQPVHQVTLSAPFWMGKYEVTQAEYQSVVGSNPSYFASAPNAPQRPVETVSWNSAIAYCQALTAAEQAAGRVPAGYQYRLPTEAEWEYCCRAGTTTEWHTGTSLSTSQANFGGSIGQTAVVGTYAPNQFGLHDMHGNVFEWCLDSYALYAPGPVTDPFVTGGAYRVIRGGSWRSSNTAPYCRSAYRSINTPGVAYDNFGFRVVLAPVLVP